MHTVFKESEGRGPVSKGSRFARTHKYTLHTHAHTHALHTYYMPLMDCSCCAQPSAPVWLALSGWHGPRAMVGCRCTARSRACARTCVPCYSVSVAFDACSITIRGGRWLWWVSTTASQFCDICPLARWCLRTPRSGSSSSGSSLRTLHSTRREGMTQSRSCRNGRAACF